LEAVLVSKGRKAEQDWMAERNEKRALQQAQTALQKELAEAQKTKEESVQLVAALEKDLEKAIQAPVMSTKKKPSVKETPMPQENPATLQHILDPKAAPPPQPAPSPPSLSEKAQDDHSVATIVMAQRDRLRARCEALEAARDSFKRELQAQVSAAESFKVDNTKLYEKVRYLHNFGQQRNSSVAQQQQHRDLDLEALEQRYEASVDPFRQFSKTERQRKLKEMSPMERTVYVVAKTVLCTS